MSRLTQVGEGAPPAPQNLGAATRGRQSAQGISKAPGAGKTRLARSWANGSCPWVFLEITLQSLGEAWPFAPGVAKTPHDLKTGPHLYSLAGQPRCAAGTHDKAQTVRYLRFGSALGAAGC